MKLLSFEIPVAYYFNKKANFYCYDLLFVFLDPNLIFC